MESLIKVANTTSKAYSLRNGICRATVYRSLLEVDTSSRYRLTLIV